MMRLDDAFLAEVRNLPERNLAVELLERLLEGEIKSRFAGNVVQNKKFSDMLTDVVQRYQNRSIEAAQVMEELVEMAKRFRAAAARGEQLGLTEDEVRFYDALVHNESAVRELTDATLKLIAHELTENLRQNLTVDWSARESVQARLRLMVKRILRKHNPDLDIVFWTYNWGWAPEEDRLALIRSLPTDISLQATFEMFEDVVKEGKRPNKGAPPTTFYRVNPKVHQ